MSIVPGKVLYRAAVSWFAGFEHPGSIGGNGFRQPPPLLYPPPEKQGSRMERGTVKSS